jgi:hypothetical protein
MNPQITAVLVAEHRRELTLCSPQLDDAPIRTHVLMFAQRQTRACLRADTCDVLAMTR